jgi:hypothetical protein
MREIEFRFINAGDSGNLMEAPPELRTVYGLFGTPSLKAGLRFLTTFFDAYESIKSGQIVEASDPVDFYDCVRVEKDNCALSWSHSFSNS